MLTALFKVFPFLWPFLKELILGGKNHPMFTNRKNASWVKPIIGFMIVIIVSLGDAYLSSLKEIETLKANLSSKKSSEVNQQTVGLMLCERDLAKLTGDLQTLKTGIDLGVYNCKEAKQQFVDITEKPLPSKVVPNPTVPPEAIKETQRQRALRKLDELKVIEQ